MKRLVSTITVLLLVVACSVPTEERAQVIGQDELPENLRRVTTTMPATTLPLDIRDVTYFLLFTPEDQEQLKVSPVVRQIPMTDVLTLLIEPMFAPDFRSEEEAADGLINQVTQYEFVRVLRPPESSVATVELTVIDQENPPDNEGLVDVAAQLVWTLSEFGSVDSILITIDGEEQGLPTDNEGDVDRPVRKEDYSRYDPEFTLPPVEPPTTTTTEAPDG